MAKNDHYGLRTTEREQQILRVKEGSFQPELEEALE
jgi:hypothetical protein